VPKFLVQGSYTSDGLTGVLREGGTSRRAAAEAAVESVGGRLEAFYFAFGSADFFVIADLPDQRTAAAVSMAANAGGQIHSTMVVLITPEELDEAAKTVVSFRAPGT